eukprot:scaffold8622_cov58-Cylindrotheca_fusiformis.AAC.1
MGHSCLVAAPVAVDVDIAGIAAVDTDTAIAAADIEEQQLPTCIYISLADAGPSASEETRALLCAATKRSIEATSSNGMWLDTKAIVFNAV